MFFLPIVGLTVNTIIFCIKRFFDIKHFISLLWNGLWLYHPDIDEQVIIADTYYHDDIGRPKHGDLRIRYIPKSQCFVIDKYTRYVDEVANVHRWRWKVHDILKHDPTKGR